MPPRQTLRLVTAYYWAVSVFVVYFGVISSLYELVAQPAAFNADTFPLLILPSCIYACIMALAARGLSLSSTWGYGMSIAAQLISLLVSLIAFLFLPVPGLVFGVLNGVILLFLLDKAVEEKTVATRGPSPFVRQQRGVVINRVITILLACSCLALVGWCGVSEYTAHTMSGYQAMLRLAGITDGSVTSERLRLALLERVPVGTSQDATVAFLEMHDVPADRFVGGQFVRYQTGHQYILALFSSPPWVIELFCSQYHSGVRFIFDGNGDLEDIIVENYASCL